MKRGAMLQRAAVVDVSALLACELARFRCRCYADAAQIAFARGGAVTLEAPRGGAARSAARHTKVRAESYGARLMFFLSRRRAAHVACRLTQWAGICRSSYTLPLFAIAASFDFGWRMEVSRRRAVFYAVCVAQASCRMVCRAAAYAADACVTLQICFHEGEASMLWFYALRVKMLAIYIRLVIGVWR